LNSSDYTLIIFQKELLDNEDLNNIQVVAFQSAYSSG
jgi:hypothetical protein